MSRCFPSNDHENDTFRKLNQSLNNCKNHKTSCCCQTGINPNNMEINNYQTESPQINNCTSKTCDKSDIDKIKHIYYPQYLDRQKIKIKESIQAIKKNNNSHLAEKRATDEIEDSLGCTVSWMDQKFDELIDSTDIGFVTDAIKSVNNGQFPSNKNFEILKKLSLTVGSSFDDVTLSFDKVKADISLNQIMNSVDYDKLNHLPDSSNIVKNIAFSSRFHPHIECAEADIQSTRNDYTPLMEASFTNQLDVVNLLLSRGSEINDQSSSGNTALHCACENGHIEIVKILLEKGANLEIQNDNGHTPLMEAASAGHVEIASILLNNGADINAHSSEYKESALTLACYRGRLEMVKFLLNNGADGHHKTEDMHTALMEASMDGHVEVAKLLIERGAMVNMPEDGFESPLMLAVSGDHLELASLLIECGADLNEVNDEGITPLLEACREGFVSMVQILVKSGADVNFKTEESQDTCLSIACFFGYLDIVKILLETSLNVNIELGIPSPLIEASTRGHYEIVQLLLSKGANVSSKTPTGDTAICYASENGHTSIVDLLLNHGANIEYQSDDGRTPLMKASSNGHFCTVEYLISRNANINKYSLNNECTALSIAAYNGHSHVVRLLLSRLADPLTKLKDESNALIEACKNGHYNTAFIIIESIYHYQRIKMEIENNNHQQFINGCCCLEHLETLVNESILMHQLNENENDCVTFICKDARCPIKLHQGMLSMSTLEGDICPCIEHHWNIVFNNLGSAYGFNRLAQNKVFCDNGCGNHNNQCPCFHSKGEENSVTDLKTSKTSLASSILTKSIQKMDNKVKTIDLSSGSSENVISMNDRTNSDVGCRKLPPIIIDWKTLDTYETALSFATSNGHEQVVSLLIENGSNVNHRDKRGFTPLISAATAGNTSICKILLDNNADIHMQTERTRETALSYAASAGKFEVVEMLLQHGADPEHRNLSDYTPLSLAASNGCISVMRCLLAHNVDVNSRIGSKLGITPLMLASMNGHVASVRLLLEHGADVDAYIETNRNTALTLACYQGRHEVVSLLLEKKVNIEHRAKTGYTPLMEAASGGYIEVAKLLIEAGADVNAPALSVTKDTALTISSEKGHLYFVEQLLSKGANVDAKNKKSQTALWLASSNNHAEIVKLLLNHNADPNITDSRGLSALMVSFKKGYEKVVKVLVKKVNQFPSDTDCRRFISTITDAELLKNLNHCFELLREAKQRQELEAERHASNLLKDLHLEKLKEEETQKFQSIKRLEKKNQKLRSRKLKKHDETQTKAQTKKISNGHVFNSQNESDSEIIRNNESLSEKSDSDYRINNEDSYNLNFQTNDCDGWQEVSKKTPLQANKIVKIIHASMVSRLIGRNGCNINLIRESTNANIDINTNKKLPSGDCYITIKGSNSSCSMSLKIIDIMTEHVEWSVKDVLDFLNGSKTITQINKLREITKNNLQKAANKMPNIKLEKPIKNLKKFDKNNIPIEKNNQINKSESYNSIDFNEADSICNDGVGYNQQLDKFLTDLGLEKYIHIFKIDEIDMEALLLMNDNDLEEIGLDKKSRETLSKELTKLSQSRNTFNDKLSYTNNIAPISNVDSIDIFNWKINSKHHN